MQIFCRNSKYRPAMPGLSPGSVGAFSVSKGRKPDHPARIFFSKLWKKCFQWLEGRRWKMSRTVLVTGATRGIGREAVKQLCAQGFTVFATGRDPQLLDELKKETGCLGEPCNLAEPDAAVELYAAASAALGGVDILINNAGFNPGKEPVVDVSAARLDASYAINFRAPYLLCREALKEMGPRKSGHILNVVSTIARTSAPNYSTYCSLKYALHGFTLCLIKEAQLVNVKVTGVYPGGTDTDFRAESRPDYLKPESAAQMIVQCIAAPADVVVHELVYRPMIETNF
jgi:NAD(P)-dependent dehydrogenase (short-subunit alcohol dehydrogenase family)